MKRAVLLIFLFCIIFFCSCNGDLLNEGDSSDSMSEIKLRGIWLVGGLSGNGTNTVVTQIDLYDPVTDTWYGNVASVSGYTPVSYAAVASANSKIYVIGGFDTSGTVANLAQEYDISTDTWSSKSTTNFTACANISGAVSDNKIFVLGGTTGNASSGWTTTVSTATQCYNITADAWITGLVTFGTAANRFSTAYNGIIYNIGGRSAAATLITDHNGYTVISNTNTSGTETAIVNVPATPTGRIGSAGAIYRYPDGYIYMFIVGGATAITGCSTNYIFQTAPSTYTTTNTFQYMSYSPALSTWTASTVLTISTGFGSAAIYDGILYFFGGNSSATPSGLDSTFSMDVSSRGSYGSWSSEADMPIGRYGHAAITITQ